MNRYERYLKTKPPQTHPGFQVGMKYPIGTLPVATVVKSRSYAGRLLTVTSESPRDVLGYEYGDCIIVRMVGSGEPFRANKEALYEVVE